MEFKEDRKKMLESGMTKNDVQEMISARWAKDFQKEFRADWLERDKERLRKSSMTEMEIATYIYKFWEANDGSWIRLFRRIRYENNIFIVAHNGNLRLGILWIIYYIFIKYPFYEIFKRKRGNIT